jgi:hypothetical protein
MYVVARRTSRKERTARNVTPLKLSDDGSVVRESPITFEMHRSIVIKEYRVEEATGEINGAGGCGL